LRERVAKIQPKLNSRRGAFMIFGGPCGPTLSAIDIPEGDTVRELLLAHRRPDMHEIYDQYAYFREKKFALEAWANV